MPARSLPLLRGESRLRTQRAEGVAQGGDVHADVLAVAGSVLVGARLAQAKVSREAVHEPHLLDGRGKEVVGGVEVGPAADDHVALELEPREEGLQRVTARGAPRSDD